MYIPKQFEETRIDILHDLMRANPLATVVTNAASGLNANHIPLQLIAAEPFGILRGHVARANPILNDLAGGETLAIFHGPQSYITPSWHATKKEHGKVVPTWNYTVVHAYGELRAIDDDAWLRTQLEALTAHNEAAFDAPWTVADAPREYIERIMTFIIGVEMVITRLIGKWKISQNQSEQNQHSVIAGLNASNFRDATAMAELIADHSKADSKK